MKPEAALRMAELFASGRRSIDDIISDARDCNSPLHDLFEWDLAKAHEIYLRDRAREVIRLWYVQQEEMGRPMRAAYSLPVLDDGEDFTLRRQREYYMTDEVFSNPTLSERLFRTALAELNAFRRKYEHLKKFQEVFDAIDRLSAVEKLPQKDNPSEVARRV